MDKITLYSTHCPQCKALETLLTQKGINFQVNDNVVEMISLGFTHAPILDVNGTLMNFKDALTWVREQ